VKQNSIAAMDKAFLFTRGPARSVRYSKYILRFTIREVGLYCNEKMLYTSKIFVMQ